MLYDISQKENDKPKLPGVGETSTQIQTKDMTYLEPFMGKQKLEELERLTHMAYDQIDDVKKAMESILSSPTEDLMEEFFIKLNQIIRGWNSNLERDRVYIGETHCQ